MRQKQVSDELKDICKTISCTQEELAWFLGISISSLKRYWIGAIPQNMLTIWAIRYLHKSIMSGKIHTLDDIKLKDLWEKP